jgi:copper chaperone NosL
MLNFVAHSWPDTGGLVIFVSLILGLTICVLEFRRRRKVRPTEATAPAGLAVASALAIGLIAGCQPQPQPLRVGEMACTHCRMTVSDARYGAELVSTTGKIYPFDAIECLVAYLEESPEASELAHSLWVAAFDEPGTLIAASDAFFLRSDEIQSPMGGGLAAFTTSDARDDALADKGGTGLDWGGLLALTEVGGTVSHAAHVH